ncbi:MarR family transcriptional regulator [Clostridia bacterium]|nr:MarR family transcriptional regulator [Clostridia bacterium]
MDLHEKFQRLMWLSRCLQHRSRAEHGPTADPSRGQGRVLAALKLQSEISTKDLAYLLGIRPQSLNELLSKLEKNGMVTRSPSEADKRVITVTLTDKGRGEQQQDSDPDCLFACLNEDEQQNLSEYLDKIIASLEERTGSVPEDEFEWMSAARERFGDNFDMLLSMRRGGNPFRHGFRG